MISSQICLHASLEAKGGPGMVALAGDKLNLVLQDLKLNRNLKINRVSTPYTIPAGSFGPFNLPSDYLRPYDFSYPLQTPNGTTQFLNPITMEQWDAEFKAIQTANYPYEYATDLSTQAQAASGTASNNGTIASVTVNNGGTGYVNPPGIALTGGGGSGAVAAAHLSYFVGTVIAGGAGYTVGDILPIVGGAGARSARYLASTVVAGVVTAVAPIDGGDYTIYPGIAAATTGGTGTGCTITLTTGVITSIVVTAPGSGYTSAPTVLIAPASGSPSATAVLGTAGATTGKGQMVIYPMSGGVINATLRYMRDQPDIVSPETSSQIPWFPYQSWLIEATAAMLMGITGDDRKPQYETALENKLRPYLIMEGDEQQTVRGVRLDPQRFRSPRGVRPTKTQPY